jgi:hypothetical protein
MSVVSNDLALRFADFDGVVGREERGEMNGEEGGACGLVKKVDILGCLDFGSFSSSSSSSFFFCSLEEGPRDSVSAISLRLRDIEEKEG